MWKDRFRKILGEAAEPRSNAVSRFPDARTGARSSSESNGSIGPLARQSSGTDQFFHELRSEESLSILDLGAASQANISFITNLGHQLSSEDILGSMEQCFGDGDFLENQAVPEKVQRFLDLVLDFPESHFHGVLGWDTFQFLAPPLLEQTIERVLRVMRPGGVLLAFFSSEEKVAKMPVYTYQIQDTKGLLLVPKHSYRPIQYFNNRAVERLFGDAQSVKFFLSRDHLREVIVRR